VDQACTSGRLVRTWLMRGTLHLAASEDVRWLVGLLGPVFAAKARRRREQLGLDEGTCESGLSAISEVLTGSPPLDRATLVERVIRRGVRIDPTTQAPAHLIGYAAMRGLICCGPDLERFVLLDDWVAPADPVPADRALAELARRYLHGHAPAEVADFVAWSGLPVTLGRQAFELSGGSDGPASGPAARARLLGHFDPLLLGYRSRDFVLDPRHAARVQAGGGFIRPVALVRGRVAGTWQLARGRIAVEPFEPLASDTEVELAADAADVGRFLGHAVTIQIG
jgi:Winged helix DNA-binding domain